ncbi:MAG: hypothetical protein EVJ46_03145 [Candidatus Acididesulfobacter guangdongensis]|uniref:Uncharacterized protein n=1 Tax=Acididesulfobacter guangdongensis TaxID=2597225 RepID=A0A519BJ11_ACIG2|nr:MAG: hypothetical protein EVJ46_03145 [Candidatus Acididesulfobacter guangdongensis]
MDTEKIEYGIEENFACNKENIPPLNGSEKFFVKTISGKEPETEVEIYESSEVIDKIKKSEKHFFEYFIGLW